MELNPLTGMTIELEDCGQDFLEFDIYQGEIIATRPFQGFFWDGRKVINKNIQVGDALFLNSIIHPEGMCAICYPVKSLKPLTSVRATVFYPSGSLGEVVEVA
jgi:hypothetical protein